MGSSNSLKVTETGLKQTKDVFYYLSDTWYKGAQPGFLTQKKVRRQGF